jgi:ATP-dependent Zn protease
MKYKVTFEDVIEADTEEQAYQHILAYLEECVRYDDVTAFNFEVEK